MKNRCEAEVYSIEKIDVTKLIEYHDFQVTDNEMRIKSFLTNLGPENIDDLLKGQ